MLGIYEMCESFVLYSSSFFCSMRSVLLVSMCSQTWSKVSSHGGTCWTDLGCKTRGRWETAIYTHVPLSWTSDQAWGGGGRQGWLWPWYELTFCFWLEEQEFYFDLHLNRTSPRHWLEALILTLYELTLAFPFTSNRYWRWEEQDDIDLGTSQVPPSHLCNWMKQTLTLTEAQARLLILVHRLDEETGLEFDMR